MSQVPPPPGQGPQPPFQQPPPGGTPPPAYQVPPSGASSPPGSVVAMAVINFILGGLSVVAGACFLTGAGLFGVAGQMAGQQANAELPPGQAEQVQAIAMLGGAVLFVVAVTILISAVLMIAAGVGLLKLRSWGRVLTLVLGGMAILFAVLNLATLSLIPAVICGGYAVAAFVILLNQEVAAQFH